MSWKIDRDRTPDPAPTTGPRPSSLATRLTAWYSFSAFALVLGATGFMYWLLASNLDRESDEALADQVHVLRQLLHDRPNDRAALRQEVEWEGPVRQYAHVYVRILDQDGQTIMETADMSGLLGTQVFPDPVPADAEPVGATTVHAAADRPYRVLAVQATVGVPGRPVHTIQVALDRSRVEGLLSEYRRGLWVVLGLALFGCAVIGYRIARRGIQPLREITATARRIRSNTLNERLEIPDLPAELLALATTFNEMLDRLEESFGRLARFSADIAHELRTPLNNLRGEAEVALARPRSPDEYREVLGSSLEELERLSRMIDGLLFLARAENPEVEIDREPLDVGQELEGIRDYYEAAAAEAGVQLQVSRPKQAVAALNRALIQRAVVNLVENALAHTPPDGIITLSAVVKEGAIEIEVADPGAGISPVDLPHVFDRFYRADRARSSAGGRFGLGLAIVKSIADLHRGSVHIASKTGQGTRVTLRFPQQTAPPAALLTAVVDGQPR
jgi:two-component system, OmpR family, heavy metal sensor histidine kinase CusS